MFVREEVSSEETFKVEGIPLKPYFVSGPKARLTKSKVGLYNITSTMEEWAEDLLSRLKSERALRGRPLKPMEVEPIFMENPEWVNDDTGLIGLCHRLTANQKGLQKISLISGDRRLANKIANTCNVEVIRISPQEFVRLSVARGLEISHETDPSFLKGMLGPKVEHVLKDTGSISASAVHMVEEEGEIFHRSVTSSGWEGEHRVSHITLARVKRTHLRKEVHRPESRPRIWRQSSRPQESVYSSHASWRETRTSRSGSSSWWRPTGAPTLPTRSTR
jgi:hypothetical protein